MLAYARSCLARDLPRSLGLRRPARPFLRLGLERSQHHLGVFADFLLQRGADQLGEGGDAEVVLDAEHDACRRAVLFDRPGAFERVEVAFDKGCLLYTSPSPRDRQKSRMPSSA